MASEERTDELHSTSVAIEPASDSERNETSISPSERGVHAEQRRLEAAQAEYRRLWEQYPPPPDIKAAFADANWVDSVAATDIFDAYRGLYIAVADRAVRATGEFHIEAEVAGAKAYHCHPWRLFVCYVPRIDEY